MAVVIRLSGVEAATKELERVSLKLKDLREVHRRIGVRLVAWGQQNFREGGTERAWKPLAASTVFGRRGGSSKPLMDTGGLSKTFLEFKATSTEVVWGSTSPIAAFHHFGTGPYTIEPKVKKSLAFPSPFGKKLGKSTVGKILAGERTGRRSSFRAKGRSRADLGRLGFLVVKKVKHPGLASRPLLPTTATAERMATEVLRQYIDEVTGRR